ncbi:MAG TPA: cytochrome P450 [Vicinamibacterales bacterium]|nr:cytochrome P450 [Vicinamibacterales bacterium]
MDSNGVAVPSDIAETLVNPRAYADHRIHEAYRWLRKNNPLGLAAPPGFDPFWAVVSYADIQYVTRNNDLFHNGDRSALIVDQASDRLTRQVTGGSPHLTRSLVQLDGEEHRKLRLLTQSWFMPANIRRLETRIRELARDTVEKMLAKGGHCDFVNEVALHYPLKVVMEVLGVPAADEPLMLKLTQEIFGPQDPDSTPLAGQPDAAALMSRALQATMQMMGEYFGRLAAERRAAPTQDLISVIANARVDGQPLGPVEELGYYAIVATAGHDTTSSSTAGAIWALCDNPAEFAKVKADPSLIPSLVDEAIRWTSPVKTFMRTATADTELAGRRIAKGDWLMLCFASANRDEATFSDPYTFRIDRPGQGKHIAFGGGAHVCLGQHLARMEIRILFEELLPRLKSIALDGAPKMSEAIFVNGPKSLPIRFEVA